MAGIVDLKKVADISRALAPAEAAAAAAAARGQRLSLAISKLQATWQPLPVGPYPPASDDSFPRTGDPSLVVSASSVGISQRMEPVRAAQGIIVQADARRPKLSPLFWVGLAALGVGIYLKRH